MAVYLVATLDTKGNEASYARGVLASHGLAVRVVDVGSLGPPRFAADVPREEVFRRAGTTAAEVMAAGDRGAAVGAAARGAGALMGELLAAGGVEGVFGLGGSAGTVIGTAAMRALPFGTPKVMVSTLASGQTRPYVGGSDIFMLYPVADIAGLNRLTRAALSNAANAMAGMVLGLRGRAAPPAEAERPLVAATMFGVTTPCVDQARKALEAAGVEVLVFHATGVGGESMEGLVRDGRLAGVLDLTTTELADELVGGILSAGPARLEAAVKAGVPQVVSLGALDMVNFGPAATVPERFAGRLIHAHNPSVTLLRTTPEENAALGRGMARILSEARREIVVMVPLRGVSALDAPGRPFFDPEADGALFRALAEGLEGLPCVRLDYRDEHINDPTFGLAAAAHLLALLGMTARAPTGDRPVIG